MDQIKSKNPLLSSQTIIKMSCRKFRYAETPILASPNVFSKGAHEGKRSVNSRRATVLNKLFMRYITDLMVSGDCSEAFSGYSVEINRVRRLVLC